eukprot:COSAG02_NODE_7314_length_3069_cov_2.031650_3_plen_79_part_00
MPRVTQPTNTWAQSVYIGIELAVDAGAPLHQVVLETFCVDAPTRDEPAEVGNLVSERLFAIRSPELPCFRAGSRLRSE